MSLPSFASSSTSQPEPIPWLLREMQTLLPQSWFWSFLCPCPFGFCNSLVLKSRCALSGLCGLRACLFSSLQLHIKPFCPSHNISFSVAFWVLLSVLESPGSLASSCSKYCVYMLSEQGAHIKKKELLTSCLRGAFLPSSHGTIFAVR